MKKIYKTPRIVAVDFEIENGFSASMPFINPDNTVTLTGSSECVWNGVTIEEGYEPSQNDMTEGIGFAGRVYF